MKSVPEFFFFIIWDLCNSTVPNFDMCSIIKVAGGEGNREAYINVTGSDGGW